MPQSPGPFLRLLRDHWTLVLHIDDEGDARAIASPYVLDPASDRVILALEPHLRPAEGVLFIPDDGWDALEVLAALAPLADSPAADRFRAAHPANSRAALFAARALSAKHRGEVADEDELSLSFSWLDREQELRRLLNADRGLLARAAAHHLGAPCPDCLALSVDPGGVLIRTRLGPGRLGFTSPCETFDDALAAVHLMLKDPTP